MVIKTFGNVNVEPTEGSWGLGLYQGNRFTLPERGKNFHIKAYVAAQPGTEGLSRGGIHDVNGNKVAESINEEQLTTTFAWHDYQFPIELPAGEYWLDVGVASTVNIRIRYSNVAGTLYAGAQFTTYPTLPSIISALPYTCRMSIYAEYEPVGGVPPIQYTLGIESRGNGYTIPATGNHVYDAGTPVIITAMSDSGYELYGWELDGVVHNGENPVQVTMNSNHLVAAIFQVSTTPPPTGELFDACDSLNPPNGPWACTIDATFATNTIAVVNGKLVMTFAAVPQTYAYNFGGIFYKRPASGLWSFIGKELVRFRITKNGALSANSLVNLGLEIITDPWISSKYLIGNKLITTDTEIIVDIDLRNPASGELTPDLSRIRQFGFYLFGDEKISGPTQFTVDIIELLPPAYTPVELVSLTVPEKAVIGSEVTFVANVRNGILPYSYQWNIDGAPFTGTSSTITIIVPELGLHTVTCTVTDTGDAQNTPTQDTLTANFESVVPPPPPITATKDYLRSELRGMFIHTPWSGATPDWPTVVQTCYDGGINSICLETYTSHFLNNLKTASINSLINECHVRGLKLHILLCVGLEGTLSGYTNTSTLDATGTPTNWLCPNRPNSRAAIKHVVEKMVTDHNIDGFMFDYTRWGDGTQRDCYCPDCRAKFEAGAYRNKPAGVTVTNFPTDVKSGGIYYWDWIVFRYKSITDFFRDIASWIHTIKPNLEISAAGFGAFEDQNSYGAMTIGQTAEVIAEGILDSCSPMVYGTRLFGPYSGGPSLNDMVQSAQKFNFGARTSFSNSIPSLPPNKPIIPFVMFSQITVISPAVWAQTYSEIIKKNGLGGFWLWRYDGPGLNKGQIDVRNYLSAVTFGPDFSIENIGVTMKATETVITWTTQIPTIGKVEYGTAPFFVVNQRQGEYGRNFTYPDIDYVGGTIIQESAPTTVHSISVPLTGQFYYRITSEDPDYTSDPVFFTTVTSPTLTSLETPPPLQFTLQITASTGGSTSPSPNPYIHPKNTVVQVTALPEAGYMLDHWELDGISVSTASSYSVLMDIDHELLAVFVEVPPPPPGKHNLTISTTVGGTTTPEAATWEFNEGTTIQVSAEPDNEHSFDHWELDGVTAKANPISILMDKDKNLLAIFTVKPVPIPLWKVGATILAGLATGIVVSKV